MRIIATAHGEIPSPPVSRGAIAIFASTACEAKATWTSSNAACVAHPLDALALRWLTAPGLGAGAPPGQGPAQAPSAADGGSASLLSFARPLLGPVPPRPDPHVDYIPSFLHDPPPRRDGRRELHVRRVARRRCERAPAHAAGGAL